MSRRPGCTSGSGRRSSARTATSRWPRPPWPPRARRRPTPIRPTTSHRRRSSASRRRSTRSTRPTRPPSRMPTPPPAGCFVVGTPLVWSYLVYNDGTSPITVFGVMDDHGTPTFADDDFEAVAVLDAEGFNVGDLNHNNLLDHGEAWRYTSAFMPPELVALGSYFNTATVTGVIAGVSVPVSDTDEAHHVGTPAPGRIVVTKYANGEDANTPGAAVYVKVGAPITWTFAVTLAAGSGPLHAIELRDHNFTTGGPAFTPTYVEGDANGDGILELGEIWRYAAPRDRRRRSDREPGPRQRRRRRRHDAPRRRSGLRVRRRPRHPHREGRQRRQPAGPDAAGGRRRPRQRVPPRHGRRLDLPRHQHRQHRRPTDRHRRRPRHAGERGRRLRPDVPRRRPRPRWAPRRRRDVAVHVGWAPPPTSPCSAATSTSAP